MRGPGYGQQSVELRLGSWSGEHPWMLMELFFLVRCVLVCLCAMTVVTQFLLWATRHAAKAEPSRLGVSMGGIPRRQSSSLWCRVAPLFDE